MLENANCASFQTINVIACLAFGAFSGSIIVLQTVFNWLLLVTNVSIKEWKIADFAGFALMRKGLRIGATEANVKVLHALS